MLGGSFLRLNHLRFYTLTRQPSIPARANESMQLLLLPLSELSMEYNRLG